MPKSMPVDPDFVRRPGYLEFPEIPLHAYARPLQAERAARGDGALVEILRHMLIVREFESMLASFKATGKYADIAYAYKGPAHLSIGQEGVAVGAALELQPQDQVFGSHRSHGEFIAKALAAIGRLDEAALTGIMQAHDGGALFGTVATVATAERHFASAGVRAQAEQFALFGLLAEIFMRANGFNGGMGGSMHAFFPPFGNYPNNAIVGASAGIATGAALRRKLSGSNGICVAMSGDGSTGCGPVYEAMNFASMAQFDRLWSSGRGGLPVLYLFSNNFYAMGGQTAGETMGWDRLSRIGAGINPAAMHAETVDGSNPLAVADAVARKRALLVEGAGPALLDIECYRVSGHSSSDANAYRTREEMAAWALHDPIESFASALQAATVIDADAVDALRVQAQATIRAVTQLAVDPATAPPVNVAADPTLVGKRMFANTERALGPTPVPLLAPLDSVARIRQNKKKARFGVATDGRLLSPLRAITLRDGLFESIVHHLAHDPDLVAYGEECREWGGAFGVHRGLSELFAHERLFNSPISEAAIVATAVGYAMTGGRALVELMYADFIGRAGDEIFNQAAKWRAMSGGTLSVPLVVRCSVGSKYGAQHSQDWSALVAHIPGLKVVYPATPYDAKGMLASALAGNDPVIFFESQRLYDVVEQFEADGVPQDYYRLPLGEPGIKRAGSDITVLTIGPSLYPALAAADELHKEFAVEAEVMDARSLVPIDYEPLLASVRRTGRLLVVSEACERGSFAMTLCANVTRFAFDALETAPRVLGAPNWIVPGADMEASYFPQPHDIVDVVMAEMFADHRRSRVGVRDWNELDLARAGL